MRDIILFAIIALAAVIAAIRFDVFHAVIRWAYANDNWELDDVLTLLVGCTLAWILFSVRRWNRLMEEISTYERAAADDRLIDSGDSLPNIDMRTPGQLVPMCAWCKSVRDRKGYWMPLEDYLEGVRDEVYSHVLCPQCARQLYSAYLPGESPHPPFATGQTGTPTILGPDRGNSNAA